MGLPVSLIIANLYMESFEQKALRSASVSPKVWYRYVDDTYVVINKDKVQKFTDHINTKIRILSLPMIQKKMGNSRFWIH